MKDLVIDIGSNDGTTLKSYKNQNCNLLGIDPSGNKFKSFIQNILNLSQIFLV